MRPSRPTDIVDTLLGFTGFFALVLLAVTIICELTGRPALGWALTLLGLVVVIALLVRRRGAVVRRHDASTGRDGSAP